MVTSQLPAVLSAVLFFGAIFVAVIGAWKVRAAWPLTFATLVGFLVAALGLLRHVVTAGPVRHRLGGWDAPIGIEYVVDGLSAFVVAVIAVVSLLVTVYARVALRAEQSSREAPFYAMTLVLLLGLSGMVLTGDLFNLYVFLEITSLAGYSLLAVGDRTAVVAAFRYLIVGTLGACLYLLGVGFLYTLTGSLNMADVAARLSELSQNPAIHVSTALIVAGLGLKMGLVPMHGWLPDAYTHASSTTTALVAPLMTKVAAYALLRLLGYVYAPHVEWAALGTALAWLSMAGILFGAVMALAQTDVKRMLAYSSVSQIGYIGLGIGLAQPWAWVGAALHVMNHATIKCCLFLVSGGVGLAGGGATVSEWRGLGRRFPWLFAAFTIAALGLVGVPPTGGFFSKWYLAAGALEAGAWPLALLLVVSSLLSAGYVFRLLECVWTGAAPENELSDPAAATQMPALILGVAVIGLGLANAWFVSSLILPALPAWLGTR